MRAKGCAGRTSVVLFLSALLFSLTGCRTVEFKSHWRDIDVKIDGQATEWHNHLVFIEQAGILVAFLNDDAYFYGCLLADSPVLRTRILQSGLTLWFDPAGGEKKTFGLKFPVGQERNLNRNRPGQEQEPFGEEPSWGGNEAGDQDLQEVFQRSLAELQIIGPDKALARRIPLAEAKGIEVKFVPTGRMFVYELKVPLIQSSEHPYAIGVQPGKAFGLGIETPRFNMGTGMRGLGGGMPGGGMRPTFGGSPGWGGGGGGPMMDEPPRELNLWAKVSLAAGSNPK